MDETRFDSLPRVFGTSADRRGAVRTVAGGAAALAALAAGNTGAKKKKKKPKPAPEPQVFAVVATTEVHFRGDINFSVFEWRYRLAYYHPDSGFGRGNIPGQFDLDTELTPDKMRAEFIETVQELTAFDLESSQGRIVDSKRIAVTIL